MDIVFALTLGLLVGFGGGIYFSGRMIGQRLKAAMRDGEITRETAASLVELGRR